MDGEWAEMGPFLRRMALEKWMTEGTGMSEDGERGMDTRCDVTLSDIAAPCQGHWRRGVPWSHKHPKTKMLQRGEFTALEGRDPPGKCQPSRAGGAERGVLGGIGAGVCSHSPWSQGSTHSLDCLELKLLF